MRKMLAVARKEFRQIVRDRRTLVILLFLPAFFLLLYGYALNWDIRHVRLAVDDRDHSSESRSLVSAFVNSGYFDLVAAADNHTISPLLDRNDVRAILIIPPGLGRAVRTARSTSVQVLLNGDNANTATTVMSYALTIVRSESARYEPDRGSAPGPGSHHPTADSPRRGAAGVARRDTPAPLRSLAAGAQPLVSVEPRIWYNPELRSTLFLVPGLIAYITMITAVVSTALSIVREKERGTMEQVRMAPIAAAPFVVGKTIPYFVISLASALGIVIAAMALFDMPMRGSWPALLLALSLFLVGALGVGLFISSIADTQQVAFQAAMLASFLPTFMLSGFIFPISSMPRFLQVVTYAVPARYFLSALRAIVLKGAGPDLFWRDLVALSGFGFAVLMLAAARLRRQWS
jgi:ABC-2 type transport system permease protein